VAQILHSGQVKHSGRQIMNFDNVIPHRAADTEQCFQEYQFHHVPQSPHRPDISPCGFFRFGDLKTKLQSQEFGKMEELQGKVAE
jgi:hypothetical protein